SLPGGDFVHLKVRSVVGLLAVCASTVFPSQVDGSLAPMMSEMREFTRRHPALTGRIAFPGRPGHEGRRLLALLTDEKLRRVLGYMLDEEEFLGPFGIRAVSRCHRDYPYVFSVRGTAYQVDYEPAESTTAMFGGNSNWRGPIWLPMNMLLVRGL